MSNSSWRYKKQLMRGTVPNLLGTGGTQNSDAPAHDVQMGGPGPRGHHLGTDALILSPGRSELMASGTSAAGGVMSSSTTRPRSSRSSQVPLKTLWKDLSYLTGGKRFALTVVM